MSQMESITIKGKPISRGTKLLAIESVSKLKKGSTVTVRWVGKKHGDLNIGVISDYPIPGWHELDGMCNDHHGYWLDCRRVSESFEILGGSGKNDHVVKGNVCFKKTPLSGMECRILSHLSNGRVFVELEKDIGAASCDGLGKKGHCVVLPISNLGTAPKKSKQKKREV